MNTLNTETLDKIRTALVKEFDPDRIILFGSHAWGVPDDESDVDLLVVVPDENVQAHHAAVRGYKALDWLPMAKDILVRASQDFNFYCRARGSLAYRISQYGKTIYERSPELAAAGS